MRNRNFTIATLMFAAAACFQPVTAQNPQGINVIFIGNSITYGACMADRQHDAPPAVVGWLLQERGTVGRVNIANLGASGTTTVDWLPKTGTFFKKVISTADTCVKNGSPTIFSLSLGTNDSAQEGTNGAPLSDEQYADNLYDIISEITKRYPAASVVVNHPIWYSPNTYNTAKYLSAGLARLDGYRRVIDDVVNNRFRGKDRGRVYVGDTEGWDTFRNSETLFTLEQGQAGTFRLHPNVAGARKLGQLWEKHIYDVWLHESPEIIKLNTGAQMLLYRCRTEATDKAIIVCPGGGYQFLASDHEGTRMAHWYSKNGYTAAVLLYNMPKGNPDVPQADVREAIGIMRKNAKEWGGYGKIGIMGSSAGGHLASTVATHFKGADAVDFQILLYPVVTMDSTFTHKGSLHNLLGPRPTDEAVRLYSNELQVTPQTPRAFVFLSTDDSLVPPQNALRYAVALISNKVPVSIHAYPTGGHGWGWSDGFFYKKQWTSELMRWLEQF